MSCIDDVELGDFVDDALEGERRDEVETHLSRCETCRALVADLHVIRLSARSLEPLTPPAHVWTRIAARLDPPSTSWGWTTFFSWDGLGAVAATLTLVTSLAWLGGRLARVVEEPAGVNEPLELALGAGMPSELQAAEGPFTEAIAGLERIASEQRDSLDPDVVDVLQASLTVIDSAIGQSREALLAEPESELAQASLVEALRQKVTLLEDTVALMNPGPLSEQRQ